MRASHAESAFSGIFYALTVLFIPPQHFGASTARPFAALEYMRMHEKCIEMPKKAWLQEVSS